MSAVCRSCQAPIDWAISDSSGRPVPVDHEPNDGGNVAVRRDEKGELRCRFSPPGDPLSDREKRGMSHFATCPDADAHRKTR